jgi:hypothetical protein
MFFTPIPKLLDTGWLIVTDKVISFTGKNVSVPEVWLVLFSHNQKLKIQGKDYFWGNDNISCRQS